MFKFVLFALVLLACAQRIFVDAVAVDEVCSAELECDAGLFCASIAGLSVDGTPLISSKRP